MRRKLMFVLPIVFLSLALTSCTSEEIEEFLEGLDKGLDKYEEQLKEKQAKQPKSLIPKDYYGVDIYPDRTNTYTNLNSFIKDYWGLRKYKKHIYDCSEMSALLERDLEDAGFDAYIAEGPTPWNKTTRHAWILVKTKRTITESYGIVQTKQYTRTEWVPIETTDSDIYNLEEKPTIGQRLSHLGWVGIIPSWDSNYKKYFQYTHLYNSIYEIPESMLHEFDWWKEAAKKFH